MLHKLPVEMLLHISIFLDKKSVVMLKRIFNNIRFNVYDFVNYNDFLEYHRRLFYAKNQQL